MDNSNILLLGYPSTGKTTFTAALWFYVTNWSKELKLKLETLAQGDHQYLNSMRDYWIQYNTVPRTLLLEEKNQRIVMRLLIPEIESKIIFDIPDFSGEIFRQQFKARSWTVEFDQRLNSISGIMLFISATDKNLTPKFISHAQELLDLLDYNETENPADGQAQDEVVEWDHDFVSSQVKIVDSLQSIGDKIKSAVPLKVSVIISAWDKTMAADLSHLPPKEWVEKKLPLLDQYLDSNKDIYDVKIFGVSAQGVDYSDADAVESLMSKKPLDRIIVQEGTDISTDISKPIFWLIS